MCKRGFPSEMTNKSATAVAGATVKHSVLRAGGVGSERTLFLQFPALVSAYSARSELISEQKSSVRPAFVE